MIETAILIIIGTIAGGYFGYRWGQEDAYRNVGIWSRTSQFDKLTEKLGDDYWSFTRH